MRAKRFVLFAACCLAWPAAAPLETTAAGYRLSAPRLPTLGRVAVYTSARLQPAAFDLGRPSAPSPLSVDSYSRLGPAGYAGAVPRAAAAALAAGQPMVFSPLPAPNEGPSHDATDTLRTLDARSAKPGSAAAGAAEAFDGSLAGETLDLSGEYEETSRRAPRTALRAAGSTDLKELRRYKVLLVPGFMSGPAIALGELAAWRGPRYFGDQLDWLREMGVECELVGIHTLQSFKHNARVIARAVEASAKPVILLTHSKGGLDALEMLISRPDLRSRVSGWIPVQAPFRGSPLAELPLASRAPALLDWIGGTREAADAMSPQRSRAYFVRHRRVIGKILRGLPIIAYASSTRKMAPDWLRLVNPPLAWLLDGAARLGGPGDGLVPARSAVLPGMSYVVADGVDHFMPFVATSRPFDRLRFTQTLLTMLLRRIADAARAS